MSDKEFEGWKKEYFTCPELIAGTENRNLKDAWQAATIIAKEEGRKGMKAEIVKKLLDKMEFGLANYIDKEF